ncbi:MAG: HlyC/CorC family transporter [Rhodospirillaceae bacterium]|jgi:magnesium and cobalt transporter|nr:HlyC/CorC family transporter [Rhodospirillaceae bacterium]MBT5751414.1 HlyC/CorC family transporter [Rhodospirillaceae bacterium]
MNDTPSLRSPHDRIADENGDGRNGSEPSTPRGFLGKLRSLWWGRGGEPSLRDALEELIEENEPAGEDIDSDSRGLITNILNLHDVTVYDVMVPRADIVAIEIETPLGELLKAMNAESHSRLPVYRDALDDVCGFVHIKDVVAWAAAPEKPFHLERVKRRVLFAAPSMRVLDMLLEMRLTRIHMAIVVDEHGGVDGLVTIEDLVEEIVGEIEDEHDSKEINSLIERPDGRYIAGARMPIAEFEEKVGPLLSPADREEDIDTLGGLVFSLAGRVPGRGEVIVHPDGHQFEVLDADPRRIKRLCVQMGPPAGSDKQQVDTGILPDEEGESAKPAKPAKPAGSPDVKSDTGT